MKHNPLGSQGNLYNVQRPREKVLGCFYATQIREERIFVDKDDLDFSTPSKYLQTRHPVRQ